MRLPASQVRTPSLNAPSSGPTMLTKLTSISRAASRGGSSTSLTGRSPSSATGLACLPATRASAAALRWLSSATLILGPEGAVSESASESAAAVWCVDAVSATRSEGAAWIIASFRRAAPRFFGLRCTRGLFWRGGSREARSGWQSTRQRSSRLSEAQPPVEARRRPVDDDCDAPIRLPRARGKRGEREGKERGKDARRAERAAGWPRRGERRITDGR
eukprot:scaffold2811_cov25-Tisochrysis_lutea.AAC.1